VKTFLFHIALLFLALPSLAQPEFEHIYTHGGYDKAEAVIQTYDDGFVIVGSTSTWGNGSSDAYIFKIDSAGNCLWSKTYGTNDIEWAQDVVETPDSGLAVLGYTNGMGAGGYDLYLLRLDSLGNLLWDTTYGGSDWDFGYAISLAPDSGFIMAGETYSFGAGNADGWIIKTDGMGAVEWDSTYGGPLNDRLFDVDTIPGGSYAAVGETESFGAGDYDMWILRLDTIGDTIWTRTKGGLCYDSGQDVLLTVAGDLAVMGTHCLSDSNIQNWLNVIDTAGVDVWDVADGGQGDEYGKAVAQQEWPGQSFYTLGNTSSFGAGVVDYLYERRTPNSGVYIAGSTFGGLSYDDAQDVIRTTDLGYIFVGSTESFNGDYSDIYILKMSNAGTVGNLVLDLNCPDNVGIAEDLAVQIGVQCYPNPMTDEATVALELPDHLQNSALDFVLFDMMGREVYRLSPSSSPFMIQPSAVNSGLYFYQVYLDGMKSGSGKLVME
jgi:hypothetical protein